MTINIAICDDEEIMLDLIYNEIKKIFKQHSREIHIHKYFKSELLIKSFKNNDYDLVFLDITMPEIDGFRTAEYLQKIKPNVNIIFVTSFEDMVYQVFFYKPLTFLKKSNLATDLQNYMKLILRAVDDKNISNLYDESGEIVRITLSEITYVETQKNYLKVYFKDNNAIEIRKTLKALLDELNSSKLIQIHRSYAVNIDNILRIKGSNIILNNGESLNVGRNFDDDVKKKFLDYMR